MSTPRPRIEVYLPADGSMASLRYLDQIQVAPLLIGRTCGNANALLASVHVVCGHAHSQAGVSAMEHAMGIMPAPSTRTARHLLVMTETVREHGVRLALDWPHLSGKVSQPGLARPFLLLASRARTALSIEQAPFMHGAQTAPGPDSASFIAEIEALLETSYFGMSPALWQQLETIDEIRDWATQTAGPAADCIGWLLNMSDIAQAAARAPNDVSLYTRHAGAPLLQTLPKGTLLARHLARLIDLASLPGRMRALLAGNEDMPAEETNPVVWTSRGALRHECALSEGRIVSYKIITPTDTHFAQGGIARNMVERASAMARPQVRKNFIQAVMQAFDPCVPYEIRSN